MDRENLILLICILFVLICYIISANNNKNNKDVNKTYPIAIYDTVYVDTSTN